MCPACRELFTDTDDVVVCPECGTPHHRKCYRINGECVNKIRHGTEFNWNTENNKTKPEEFFKNTENSEDIHVERIEVETIPEFLEKSLKVFDKIDKNKDGCTLRELIDFVDKNPLYYLPVFARIRNMGVRMSFNLSCFIFPQIYFANRKMWFWALLTSLISVILLIPTMLTFIANGVFDASNFPAPVIAEIKNNADLINSLMEICNCADCIMRVLLCLFGNNLYYKFAVKSVKKVKSRSEDNINIKEQLAMAGGTKFSNIILILLITFIMTSATIFLLEFIFSMIV